ncbi:hypothetical protein B0H17DRAFT_1049819 [Mycena rosella]|uniref:Zn(2)-C6 fungal-type domain-containing protein n=1 Tax=Mycena rosella TaxID=1033263 RepID=A0AAD7GPF2_MYCRO|nr:hypothetical protein B0H17DRAFT_1049819 [Mycena rosella]
MSSPAPSRNSLKVAAPTDGDHRKRRRNRTTQSCLNCHATKRMCDRKRPCSRCSQLGITGNCVYEVDDPNRQGKQEEGARLTNRIAELEGVIRELKNKPHSRWLADQGSPSSGTSSSPRSSSVSPLRSGGASSPNNTPGWRFPSPPGFGSSSSVPHFFSGAAGLSQPVPRSPRPSDSLASLKAAYAGLTDHMFIRQGSNCGCLNDTECYSVVLELSLRLRRTAELLACSPSHSTSSDCALNAQISDLDTFAKNSLLDVPGYDSSSMAGLNRGFGSGRSNAPSSPIIFDQSYVGSGGSGFDMGDSDNFMSWLPARRDV